MSYFQLFCLMILLPAVSSTQEKHVVVIGGGVSGLTAACELRQMGYDVTIMEKNPAVGGRATLLSKDGLF